MTQLRLPVSSPCNKIWILRVRFASAGVSDAAALIIGLSSSTAGEYVRETF